MMEMTMNPSDALAAVTHADPYPYYTELAAQDGLVFDPALGLWIAASAASVAAVLTHAACRVRPLSEPVPAALAGTPAGQIFGDLIRMNEAPRHTQPRLALQRALTAVDLSAARQRAGDIASRAWRDDGLAAWMFEVPVATMASLIGFSEQQLPALTAWMADFGLPVAAHAQPRRPDRARAGGGGAAARQLQVAAAGDAGAAAAGQLAGAGLQRGADRRLEQRRCVAGQPGGIAVADLRGDGGTDRQQHRRADARA